MLKLNNNPSLYDSIIYRSLYSSFLSFQVLDSLPNVKFDGLSDRFSRTSLTEVFGGLGLAEVHGPRLPKPDLGKMSSCLTAQFTSLKGKTGDSSTSSSQRHLHAKMRGRRGARGWCGCLGGEGEPPEITYCVADGGGGGLTLQAMTPTTPMPDEEELNEKFAELVVSSRFSWSLFIHGASALRQIASCPETIVRLTILSWLSHNIWNGPNKLPSAPHSAVLSAACVQCQ